VHVERTGERCPECVGGRRGWPRTSASTAYETACDPRLNREAGFGAGVHLREMLEGTLAGRFTQAVRTSPLAGRDLLATIHLDERQPTSRHACRSSSSRRSHSVTSHARCASEHSPSPTDARRATRTRGACLRVRRCPRTLAYSSVPVEQLALVRSTSNPLRTKREPTRPLASRAWPLRRTWCHGSQVDVPGRPSSNGLRLRRRGPSNSCAVVPPRDDHAASFRQQWRS